MLDTQTLRVFRDLRRAVRDLRDSTPLVDPELRRCTSDYATYAREYLRQNPTPAQIRIAELAEQPPYRVLVPSANNQGKTFFLAGYARYFHQKYQPSQVLITATTAAQVRDAVFRELRTSQPPLPGFMPKDTRVELAPNHFIHGFTANNPDAFQGRHERYLSIIFDEATGVHRDFWERAETMFGGHDGHSWICTYNPNDPSTPPYTEEESGLWHVVRLNALEHPNIYAELQGLPPPIPSAIRLTRVLDRLAKECQPLAGAPADESQKALCFEFPARSGIYWLPRTQAFEAQVLGRWPLLPTESLISPAQVDNCIRLHVPINLDWQLAIGCDVARFGADKSAIVVRRGRCVLHAESHQSRDSVYLIERLESLLYKFAVDEAERRTAPIYVDDTGGYGGGIVDHFRGANVCPLHMASKSLSPLRTVNMRSHLWVSLSEMITAQAIDMSRLPEDQQSQLKQELSAPRYRVDEHGRKRLEPKIHVRQRLGRSPDLADALTMAFHTP